MITTLTDAGMATVASLKEYLMNEGIHFDDNAVKADLLVLVRQSMIAKGATEDPSKKELKTDPVVEAAKAVDPAAQFPAITPQDAVRLLELKGFKDAKEVQGMIDVIKREGEMAVVQKNALKATLDDIEQREIHMKAREEALVTKAAAVQKDMIEQKGVYERLSNLRSQMKAEGASAYDVI